MLSGNVPTYLWSTLEDSTLRGAICVVQTSSGFRPATPLDFGGGGGGGSSTQVAISGSGGLIENVITFNGYNALPVIVVSGASEPVVQGSPWSAQAAQSGIWSVGLTGTNNVTVVNQPTVTSVQGNPWSASVAQSGVWQVGITGSNPVSIAAPITTYTRPASPAQQATYAFTLTGIGAFSNYSSLLPSPTGNSFSISFEPDSNNTDRVYYAFSGTAVTGTAWELRGERGFEVANLTDVFFAQATSGQRIMAHFQSF